MLEGRDEAWQETVERPVVGTHAHNWEGLERSWLVASALTRLQG